MGRENGKQVTKPQVNAFGQPVRKPSAADKRRAAAWTPFTK